jgi:transcriptional regulator with XRE-family HTH domain
MTPEQAKALGSTIRRHRQHLQLSTRALAAEAGVDMATVVRIENGNFLTPAPEKLRRLATALQIAPTELLTEAGYVTASDLPSPMPYLRAKYPDLPAEAVERAERYLTRLMRDHGVSPDGPAPGEDET